MTDQPSLEHRVQRCLQRRYVGLDNPAHHPQSLLREVWAEHEALRHDVEHYVQISAEQANDYAFVRRQAVAFIAENAELKAKLVELDDCLVWRRMVDELRQQLYDAHARLAEEFEGAERFIRKLNDSQKECDDLRAQLEAKQQQGWGPPGPIADGG